MAPRDGEEGFDELAVNLFQEFQNRRHLAQVTRDAQVGPEVREYYQVFDVPRTDSIGFPDFRILSIVISKQFLRPVWSNSRFVRLAFSPRKSQ
jgi:hypothetical protein